MSFVYRKWSEYRDSVSACEPRIISCQNTLWWLREVGDWRRLIQEAVSCEAFLFSKSEGALLWINLPVLQLWRMFPSTSLRSPLAGLFCKQYHSVQIRRGKRILCGTVSERCLERQTPLLASLSPAVLISLSNSDHSNTWCPAVPARTDMSVHNPCHVGVNDVPLNSIGLSGKPPNVAILVL